MLGIGAELEVLPAALALLARGGEERDARRRVLGSGRQRTQAGDDQRLAQAVAECWGTINGDARARGAGPLSVIDSLIAATAIHHQLTVVTRNTRHFLETGATVFDPFT